MPDIFVSPNTRLPRSGGILPVNSSGQPPTNNRSSHNPFASFMFMPDGVSFENQEPDETIILFLRKHFITNLPWIFMSLILFIIPLTVFPFLIINNLLTLFPVSFFNLITPVWYLFSFSYFLVNFLTWYFTISIVTTERILDIDFINVLHKKVAETRLSKVEDVTQKSGGFFEAFFDYGNVYVQTAGTESNFLFDEVPRPQQVVRIVNQLLERLEEV